MTTYQIKVDEGRSRARYRCTEGKGDDCGVWRSVCPQWGETPQQAANREAQAHIERCHA